MALFFTPSLFNAAQMPGLTSLNGVDGWTLMGWIRPGSTGTHVLIDVSGGTGTNTRAAIQIQGTGQLAVQARSNDGDALQSLVSAVGTFVAGELFHFAGVCNYPSKTLQIFKNGVQVATGPAAGFGAAAAANTTSNACNIGADAGSTSGFFDGVIEDPRIYNRVLGVGEISTIYACLGMDKLIQGMTNRYLFNEFAVNVSVAGPGVYVDYGSNPRNADANGAIFVPGTIVFKNGRGRQATGAVW